MKILLVSNYFPPTHNSGTEKRTLGYALQLKSLGFDPQVVCAGSWDEGNQYWNGFSDDIYQDIPVRRVHLNWNLAPNPNEYLYRNPIIAQELVNWLEDWQPDIVHITSCYTLTASVIQATHDFGLPIVLTLTDYWFICPKHTLLRSNNTLCDGLTSNHECLDCMLSGNRTYRRLNRVVDSKASEAAMEWVSRKPGLSNLRGLRGMALDMGDRKGYLAKIINIPEEIIAPSSHLAKVYKEGGVSRAIRVIRSGHDLSWLVGSPEKIPADKIRFGYIGQISPIKGLHTLISAFKLAQLNGLAQLSIFGDYEKETNYTDQLSALINDGEKTVTLCGSFSHDQLGEVLSGIDILVIPSLWRENNPRVIQEAFASKTPVIASDVGGISEFVKHEVNGLLFERGTAKDLSHQFKRVIKEPDLIAQLREGIQPVKTIKSEVEEIVSIYQELI